MLGSDCAVRLSVLVDDMREALQEQEREGEKGKNWILPLTLTSFINVNHSPAMSESVLWCSWPRHAEEPLALGFGAQSFVVSGSKCPWARYCLCGANG